MRLRVAADEPDDTSVWVENVPLDFSDSDVQWNVEQMADAGNQTAVLALELTPETWISTNGRGSVRVYRDGSMTGTRLRGKRR